MPLSEQITGVPGTFWSDPDAVVSLTHPLPLWGWALAALAVTLGVWASYRGLDGHPLRRGALGIARVLSLVVLLVLALGPRIEKGRTRVEQDRVVVLLDESRSMNTSDPSPVGGASPRIDQLERERSRLAGALEARSQRSTIDVLAFADSARPLGGIDATLSVQGERTALGAAITAALDRAGTQPVSSLLVLSDGRSSGALDPDLIERLRRSDIPVHTRAMGSGDEVRDVAVESVESPRSAFVDDIVPVEVTLSTRGYEDSDTVIVELIDERTGDVLTRDRAPADPDDPSRRRVTLMTSVSSQGDTPVSVRVAPGGVDQIPQNNTRSIEIRVVSDPIRVLYLDGHPRWEYRYLKNLLVREPSIDATCTILSRDRRYIVEGNTSTAGVPGTLEEWAPYDVVVIGDLAPELMSDTQQRTLLEHVGERGCGVLFAAGPGAMPDRWRSSTLGVLLPVRRGTAAAPLTTPGVLTLTPASRREGVLVTRPGESVPRVSDPDAGWSLLRWSAPFDRSTLKPGVRVLADLTAEGDQRGALVTTMRYGAGLAGYVGTDEIWRWRYGRGETLPERFWLPLVRSLARGTIDRRGAAARLSALPETPAPGERTTVTLDVFDQNAIDTLPETIEMLITAGGAPEPVTIELRGRGDRRETLWSPRRTGPHELSVRHPALGPDPVVARIDVARIDAETRDPSTDHGTLAQLSALTGGRVLASEDLDTFGTLAPNRTRVTALEPEITPLWDTPLILALLVTLLSIEWIGRRIMRLA